MALMKVHQVKKASEQLKKIMAGFSRFVLLGPLPVSRKVLKEALSGKTATLVIFIDGGQVHQKRIENHLGGPHKFLTIGDDDSRSASGKKTDIRLLPQKDFSDLAFALSGFQKKQKIEDILLLGFSGRSDKRLDHFLGNLGEVQLLVERIHQKVRMDQFLFLPRGCHEINLHGRFSLLSFSPTALSLKGACQYQLEKKTTLQPLSSRGISNEAQGMIQVTTEATAVIYFDGKNMS